MAYRFDYAWVKSQIGGRDRDFLRDFLRQQYDKLESLNDISDNNMSTLECAIALFTQQDRSDLCGYTCWYIIEAAIDNHRNSQFLPNDQWYPSSLPSFLYQLPQVHHCSYISNELAIPSPDDFPGVYLVLNDQLQSLFHQLEEDTSIIEDDEQRQQFLSWLTLSQNHAQDLIIFNY